MENGEKKKIRIKIAGNIFTVLSTEDDDRTYAIAETVDRQIKEICASARTAVTGAAILSALNYCDDLKALERDTASLKKQLAAYLDEITRLKEEMDSINREAGRLRNDMEIYRRRLKEQSAHSDEPVSSPSGPVRRSVSSVESEEAADDTSDNEA